jgi:hypothetical protein
MNAKPRSSGPKMIVVGIVAGLVAGWSSGCSNSRSTNVDVKKARDAFDKRRGDYGEYPSKPIAEKRRGPGAP